MLLFVVGENQMLLIHKKWGLGAGKISGPGGRLATGESALQGAIREVQGEAVARPHPLRWRYPAWPSSDHGPGKTRPDGFAGHGCGTAHRGRPIAR